MKGKEHGVLLDTIPTDCDIIIIPDAGSMQLEEQLKLNEQGKKSSHSRPSYRY